ncbi:Tuberous sclerosis 2-like protein [Coemansia sp. RSA 1933]|nr:Tuberous sclerosis 2-like protein [Coemansia sp. RSA 1933]
MRFVGQVSTGQSPFTTSLSALFRHVLRSPFAQDNRGSPGPPEANGSGGIASTIDTAATAYPTPAPAKASHTEAHPSEPQQQTITELTDMAVDSADGVCVDAVALARGHTGLLDNTTALADRLNPLQTLALDLSSSSSISRVTNISELWSLMGDIVEFAFDNSANEELMVRARILVLALLAGIAKSDPQDHDFGGDVKKTRREMLSVIAKAEGWNETILALQCAAWASDNAHCLSDSPSDWFERTQRWVKMTAHAQYARPSPANDSPKEEMVATQGALTAALGFLSSIVAVEYPVLDSFAVSSAASWLCDHGAQPRLVDKGGVEAVSWAWTEPEHLKGVLQFLKTVITYGAISRDVLLPGIMLLCTTVSSIPDCKDLCCEIIRILFTSCYMRDTLLSMNRILHRGNTSLNVLPFYKLPSMTPYQYAVNGMVYFITQVMDTGPTGFQFSLCTGNCLPVLHKAAQHMHPRVLRLIFPYLCKVVNDDRVDSMLSDDWAVLISILEDTADCRLSDHYSEEADDTPEGEKSLYGDEGERPTMAYLYDYALQSIVGVFRRGGSPTPLSLIELLYRMRAVLSDELAQSMLQFIDARGSLRPGSSEWLETLNEMMHLYYFDRARSVALRRYAVRLCGKIFAETVDVYSSDIERVPIVMSVFEQLHLEEDDRIVFHILEMLNSSLRKAIRPDLFSKIVESSARAAIEPKYYRSANSAQQQPLEDNAPMPILSEHVDNSAETAKEERSYSSYDRISLLVKCLLDVFEWRITTADAIIERNYTHWAADTIKLTDLLLDLLESEHTFHSTMRKILSVVMRLHSDSNMNLYVLSPDRDTVVDQRVSLNENSRIKLWKPVPSDKDGTTPEDAAKSDEQKEADGAAAGFRSNTVTRAIAAAAAAKVKPLVRNKGVPFPVARYVRVLLSLFQTNTNFETYYMLCEGLMHQLGNTYLFGMCGEETTRLLSYLIRHLKSDICGQDTRSRVAAADKTKILTHAYGLMISIMNQKDFLTRELEDVLITAFRDGLIVTSGATASSQICLHALSVGMLELPPAMVRSLSSTLQQLAKIYSAVRLSVHLIEFVSSLSREQVLHANLRSQDYRMLFAVAINYIRFHNNQRRREVNLSIGPSIGTPIDSSSNSNMSSRASSSHRRQGSTVTPGTASSIIASRSDTMKELALGQYVLVMAYQVIHVYYLSLNPGLKAETVDHLILGLLQSNYSRNGLDESNEVCLDMILHNYNRTSNDVLGLADAAVKEDFGPVIERSWMQHNGIVTIRAQKEGPLAQIMVRSPSGSASRIVNLPEEVMKKRAERTKLPQSPVPPAPAPTMVNTAFNTPAATIVPQPQAGIISRGRNISRNRRLHSLVISGPSGPNTDTDTLPPDSVCRLLRGELVQQSGSLIRAARLPIKFGPAPCLAQEFITAYQGLQNIDPPTQLPTHVEAVARSLRVFDTTSTIDTHKVSVAYVGPGQTTEHEILLNQQGSPAYWAFLRGLGNITRLSETKGFSAGLDTSGQDGDGRYTITWRDLVGKLVFHVGTLMPAQKGEQEKLLRKKAHMGNDYVHIVFNESGKEYEFNTIYTQFNFVQIIVTPVDGQTSVQEDSSTWSQTEPAYNGPRFEQLYKVKTQVNPDVPFVGPAMEPKLLALSALPLFVRSVAIHAALFSQVFSNSNIVDTYATEFISPWRARLRIIKRIRLHMLSEAKKSMEAAAAAATAAAAQQNQQGDSSGGLAAPKPPLQPGLEEFGDIVTDPSKARTGSQALGFLIKDLEAFRGAA